MDHTWTEVYWRIANAHSMELKGNIGWQNKRGISLGCGRKQIKKTGIEKCWLQQDARSPADDAL
eukprot:8860906-Ditylum_brightwellii.AAC.1